MMPKFAANLSMMFTEVPFLDRFEAASKAGFEFVEYLFPYDYPAAELKEKLDKNNLKQVLFNTAPGNVEAGEWGVSAIPGREADSHRDIDLALEYALTLGCPNVHIMSGVVPTGADYDAYKQTFINNVRYAADKYQPHGIKILLEALSPQVKPKYLIASQYQTLDLVEAIDRDNVFVQLDYFHAQNVDGNLSQLTDKLNGKFAHVQIASVPERHEPDQGEINYDYIFKKLDDIGYDGWVGCEYNPAGDTVAGLGWFKRWRN